MTMTTGRTPRWMIGVAAILLMVAGCGEEPDPQGQDNDAANQQSNDGPNAQEAEDCAEDEYYHPLAGECRLDEPEDDNEDNDDSGDDNDGPDINDQTNDDQPCGDGSIEGQSCRPDGGVLPGAQVIVAGEDCDGQSFEETTTADSEGFYEFEEIPAGDHELTVTSGSFTNTDEVTVYPDEKTDLTDEAVKVCLDGEEAEIAVFGGMFDDVGQLLDNMEVDYDSFGGSNNLGDEGKELFLDQDALLEYDILFLECQVDKPDGPEEEIALANLRRFVNEGNSVYASDRAHPWIVMGFYETDPIPFEVEYDDPDADNFRSQIQQTNPGGRTGTYTADVLSDEMYNLLGQDTVEFHFDTGNWSIVDDDVGPTTTAHFSLDPDIWGSTSGDYEGASAVTTYDDPVMDGRIIYTSFHNSQQDQLDDTMEEILEYMIFQL